MRNTSKVLVAAACMGFAWAAWAAGAAGIGRLKGQIIASDQPLPTVDDENKFLDAIKKWGKTEIAKEKGSNGWTFHIVAFPDKKPATTQLSLILWDVAGGKRDYLTRKDISCDPEAQILAADIDISVDDGIKTDHPVELILAKLSGDDETVLARTKLTFK